MNKNTWLDICRSLAISLVLLSHSRIYLVESWPQLNTLKFGGFLGVELFFVLSGFLIGRILLEEMSSDQSLNWIKEFWARRWLRTLPNYYFFLGVNVLIMIYGIRPADGFSFWQYIFFVQNLQSAHPAFMPEAWSLAVEEIFYLVVPLILGVGTFTGAKNPRIFITVVALIFLISTSCRILVVLLHNPTFDEGIRKITLLRLDSIAVGLALAWVVRKQYLKDAVLERVALVVCSLCLPLVIYLAALPDPILNASTIARIGLFTLTSVGCGALILCGLSYQAPRIVRITATWVAGISYSAYLANLPVRYLIDWSMLGAGQSIVENLLRWIVFIGITLGISAATRAFIEIPFLKLRDNLFSSPKGKLGPDWNVRH